MFQNPKSLTSYHKKVYAALRIACAMCFIGHGAFGIITKAAWLPYFAVFGIGEPAGWQLMPYVGIMNILMGCIILIYPLRAAVLWLVCWGLLTAALRPISGEPFAEFLERAGNYGAPLVLLFACASQRRFSGTLLHPLKAAAPGDPAVVMWGLRIAVFLLLAGHGWLNIIEKPSLLQQYQHAGFSSPALTAQLIGWFEVLSAISVLIHPTRSIVLFLFFWKVFSELFYPHYGLFEWIERGGSYGVILALWLMLMAEKKEKARQISSFDGPYSPNHIFSKPAHSSI